MTIEVRRYVQIDSEIPRDPLEVKEFERYDEVTRDEYEQLTAQVEALQAQAQSLILQASQANGQSQEILNRISAVEQINGIKGLGAEQQFTGTTYDVVGFYANTLLGGGDFIWNPLRNKTEHNGGTIIAPEAISAWDGTSTNLMQLLGWTGTGFGCFERIDQSYVIEYFGASNTHNFNHLPINHICMLPTNKPLKTVTQLLYPSYHFSAPIDFRNRSCDLKRITLRAVSSFSAAPGTILVRTGTTQVSIRDSRHFYIKIDGNAGSISGGISNAANQANAFIALQIYGDRTPKSDYFIDLTNCTYGIIATEDCECTDFEVHASYVDYLIDEQQADQSYWRIFAKYCGQFFKSDGQSSGYAFFMVEQSVDKGVPSIDINGGKSYSLGGEVRAINTAIMIDDSPTGGSGTGHINFDDLQIVQARTNLAMRIKNVDVVSGSFYLENYTAGGVVLDDIRCCAGLTMNLSDCRGGVPLQVSDLGTTLRYNSRVNVNISRSTGGTPSANAIQIDSAYNSTFVIGQCHGDIAIGAGVSQVQMDIDASFVYNSCQIIKDPNAGYVGAKIGGIIPMAHVETRVKPWAFNGLQLENVYRDNGYTSPMFWSNTGFIAGKTLQTTVTQLSVQRDLYDINQMFKVAATPVWLIDLNKMAYPSGLTPTPTSTWVDEAGAVVVPTIDANDLKYTCDFSGDASYNLSNDQFTIVRPDSSNIGQLVYTLPNGTYSVSINNISGGAINIRDNTTIRQQVNPGTTGTYSILITSGQMRIQAQSSPTTIIFRMLSVYPA